MSTALIAILAIAFAASLALTGWIRGLAMTSGLMDVPNERSSHVAPVPRGGGLAFVAVSLAAVAAGFLLGVVPRPLASALIVGGSVIAFIGWLDDRMNVAPATRFVVQIGAAWWAIHTLNGSPIGASVGFVATLLGVVWMVNLFNFMDGLDGIAATQAASACVFAAIALGFTADIAIAYCCSVIAAAVGGFLWWNRPPAKIFMGDVGSGTLGFLLATLALASHRAATVGSIGWGFLLAPFIVDATCTLCVRTLRGERPWKPHRDHVYQRAARRWGSHLSVTVGYVVVEAVLGSALLFWHGRVPVAGLVAAYAGLLALYVVLRLTTRKV